MSVDPILLAVIANRLDSVVREMENTLLRTGRSGVLNMARDFSCAIVTADNDLLASAEGLPVHIFGAQLLGAAMTDLHDDLAEGDAFLHNDPYLGNSHPADHVILVPVFHEGVHMFTTVAKAHQADTGNAEPTTYMPFARDIYNEGGVIFPCVRVQRDRRDIDDVIRVGQRRIRVPDQWYGDYLAMVGAARIGEAGLKEVCARYGNELVREFIAEWFDYSEAKMAHAIAQMPAGRITGHGMHDPIDDQLPDGIPINVTITVDPEEATVELDLRDNIDCIPAGLNQSEACTVSNVMTGIFNSIEPGIPANSGAFRRIRLLLRDNCIVGRPQFPHSTSVATTNIGDRLVVTTQKAIADAWPGFGVAEGATGLGPGFAVVSGTDMRRRGEPYVNQYFLGTQGGPANVDTDGWVTYGLAVASGLMFRDSVEVSEQKYPIRVGELRIRMDSEGAGRRRGAPGTTVRYGPRWDPMGAAYVTDCVTYPPRGTQGGGPAARNIPFRASADGDETEIAPLDSVVIAPGEAIGQHSTGGGGYGDPLEREPERVRDDVLAGFVSFGRARDVYGVAFVEEALSSSLEVDLEATRARRAELRTG
ncbi:hydantoinase B/oxoprolinase family protein [Capillimicrobium parvum]|uniref:Acetophenone carboxylase delta subunit n=1 Tax=Capillimicrobium parvum TaxID=2884022 RepID=A0A9E7C0T4_9ACTN|nr:hydantoinase B/oxoprolinase family protein [Capillimicrobium parvum]UGS35954.1 Acetophenone carboxylase delta subunit [Capillimicrobium parvum]